MAIRPHVTDELLYEMPDFADEPVRAIVARSAEDRWAVRRPRLVALRLDVGVVLVTATRCGIRVGLGVVVSGRPQQLCRGKACTRNVVHRRERLRDGLVVAVGERLGGIVGPGHARLS